ncbi:disulfide isomerase [Trinorchestia longiramus]|nr:disulfide isomerase [Trinorchestia longiramus]
MVSVLKTNYITCLLLSLCFNRLIVSANEDEVAAEEDIPVVEGTAPDMIIPEEDGVLVLNFDNFERIVATRKHLLVEFYAPWCGHCKTLAPEYAIAAQKLKQNGLHLAKVDATQESALAKHYGVTGYPTLKYFESGKLVEDYNGGRTSTAIIEFMKKKSDPNYKPPPSDVIELTAEDFEEKVKAAPLMLVEFYSPSCPACEQIAPEYASAASDLLKVNIPLAKIDAVANDELAKKYSVSNYPTFKVFRHGQAFEYKGQRGGSFFVSYMKEMALIPSEDLRTVTNAKNAVQRNMPTIFGHFSKRDSVFYNEFITAANSLRGDLKFVHTFNAAVAREYGVALDTVAVIMPEIYQSQYDDKIRVMQQGATADWASIVSWAKQQSVPLLGERTPANQALLYTARPLLVIYCDVDFSHQHIGDSWYQHIGAAQHLRNKLLPFVHKHSDEFTFALSNEETYAQEMVGLGLGETGEDVNAAIFTGTQKFAMEPDEEYVQQLEEFIRKYQAGKLKPYRKSQPVPKKQKGPVKVLVANNFEQNVLKGTKDHLIEFYAPWCGHCKKLEPEYKKLAKDLAKSEPGVVVAKFDATANDLPLLFDVKGFPTIYYVSASDVNRPVLFEGDRTADGLKEFVKEQRVKHARKDEL